MMAMEPEDEKDPKSMCGVVQGSRGGRVVLLKVDRCCYKGHGQGREFR
jgi:hypothetical protein